MKFSQYREVKQHGSPSFPVQYYYIDSKHPHYVMPLHWHGEFEIIYVKKGSLRLYLNEELHIGSEGTVFFVASGTLHRAEPNDCIYECIVFNTKLISGHDISKISEYILPITSNDVEVDANCPVAEKSAIELFSIISEADKYFELYVISLLHKIFYELYSSGAIKEIKKKSRPYTHRRSQMILLLEKIGREYTGKISFSELADFCGIDEKYLFRVFKEFTGCTPTEYINKLRIDRACYLMTVKKLSVTDASFESGFNELAYFSRVFKKYKGITPGSYKKMYLERLNEIE